MAHISKNLQKVLQQIEIAAQKTGRKGSDIVCVAVSKKHPISSIKEAYNAGVRIFAENYVQEATLKMEQLTDLDIIWHFIGHIQANKTKQIAKYFSWVQSVASLQIAKRLNMHRPKELGPLNILIQVNITKEASKAGVDIDAVEELAGQILSLPRLNLRGLMAMGSVNYSSNENIASYNKLVNKYKLLVEHGFLLDTLSFGMSSDFELAISCASNMVRLGTVIFGQRE